MDLANPEPSRHNGNDTAQRYNAPGLSNTAFKTSEYRLSVPDVNNVSQDDWMRSGWEKGRAEVRSSSGLL